MHFTFTSQNEHINTCTQIKKLYRNTYKYIHIHRVTHVLLSVDDRGIWFRFGLLSMWVMRVSIYVYMYLCNFPTYICK